MSTFDPPIEACSPLMDVPDLFYNILNCFRPTVDPIARQALVSLAQTCNAFSEPPLDCLWRSLRSLKPLIWCYRTVNEAENLIPPTSSQFSIIGRYSHRIRELTISEDTSLRFLQCTSMRPFLLLPNLTVLRWSPYVPTPHISIIWIQRLLSPSLISLEATLSEADGATLFSFFDNYPLLCGNLKSIEFRFSTRLQSTTTIEALSRALCRQKIIENVIIHAPIDGNALKYLSTLSTLKTLTVTLSEISQPPVGSFLPTDPIFCSTEQLEFATSDLPFVTSLLRPSKQIFHTFRLYLGWPIHLRGRCYFFECAYVWIAPKPPPAPHYIGWRFFHPFPVDQMASDAPYYRLSYMTLHPLTALKSLRVLAIEWNEQISLDDDELRKLARSWPLLQVFNVYCGRGGYPPFSTKYATLLGLLSLVDSCPELHTVGLPLDATQIPVIDGTKARETDFTCLIVPESPINQALPVAEFLFKYLPSVTMVDWKFLRPPETNDVQILAYEQAWQQVCIYLQEFHNPSSDTVESDVDVDVDEA